MVKYRFAGIEGSVFSMKINAVDGKVERLL
jgi:hypothetical protein